MRIGVIFAAYNCEEFVDRCLEPWFKLRDTHDFILTVTSGRFSDYQKIGIPNKNKKTLNKLVSWDFDYLSITGGENLLDEDSSRNRCLEYLKSYDCDVIWLVDLDEFYTTDQILSILNYIEETPQVNNFWINFKNYTIRLPLFLFWKRPTLYRNKVNGGIEKFYFDSYFKYSDGSSIENEPNGTIPREIAVIDHFSWISTESVKDKIKYQNYRYCGPDGNFPLNLRCSFVWDEKNDRVDFNKDFWSCEGLESGFQNKLQIPILHEEVDENFTFLFDLDFDRRKNILNIFNHKAQGEYFFDLKTFDGLTVYSTTIELSPGINYWIAPPSNRILDQEEGFKYLRVDVYKGQNIIHKENLHFKVFED